MYPGNRYEVGYPGIRILVRTDYIAIQSAAPTESERLETYRTPFQVHPVDAVPSLHRKPRQAIDAELVYLLHDDRVEPVGIAARFIVINQPRTIVPGKVGKHLREVGTLGTLVYALEVSLSVVLRIDLVPGDFEVINLLELDVL